ncbi:MAG: energy-coupled thiamine transporter ThiT, partial [Clostridiales bacterium]|nr:energy-coupled thiamine transporter ThiT [Clostridiales bacterium]
MLNDIKTYFANFDDATNTCRTIALWVTIALLVAFVVTRLYIVIARKKPSYDEATLTAASKISNGAWIVIALTAAVCYIVTFTACYFADVAHGKDSLFPILFYPLLVFVISVVASAITLFIKPNLIAKIVCAAVVGSALIAVIVCMIVYYTSGKAAENNWTDVLSNIGLYLSAGILAAGIIIAAFFLNRKSKPIDTRTITYAAVCVALSFALSYVRLFKMPMGGSITFASMLPLMLFAFMFGSRKGVAVGAIYGVLQAIQDPWIIHPAQFALDYLVAF